MVSSGAVAPPPSDATEGVKYPDHGHVQQSDAARRALTPMLARTR